MLITISIFAHPNWDCDGDGYFDNVNAFQNSGYITLSVFIDGINAGSSGDMLGAFVADELRGLGIPTLVPFGPYAGTFQFQVSIYSNQDYGEQVSFKFYDNETEIVYNFSESFELISDMILGDIITPEFLDSSVAVYDYASCEGDDCPSGIYDCAGTCDGDAVVDACGVCGGYNTCTNPCYNVICDEDPEMICIDGECVYENEQGDTGGDDDFILGDLNNDGLINVTDIVLLVEWILNGGANDLGDLNQDGAINVVDIVMLVDIILNP